MSHDDDPIQHKPPIRADDRRIGFEKGEKVLLTWPDDTDADAQLVIEELIEAGIVDPDIAPDKRLAALHLLERWTDEKFIQGGAEALKRLAENVPCTREGAKVKAMIQAGHESTYADLARSVGQSKFALWRGATTLRQDVLLHSQKMQKIAKRRK